LGCSRHRKGIAEFSGGSTQYRVSGGFGAEFLGERTMEKHNFDASGNNFSY